MKDFVKRVGKQLDMADKTFSSHFNMLLDKLKKGEHFGYCRFSDGELRIMQNLELQLGSHTLTKQ